VHIPLKSAAKNAGKTTSPMSTKPLLAAEFLLALQAHADALLGKIVVVADGARPSRDSHTLLSPRSICRNVEVGHTVPVKVLMG
jgi:hypothetical protein